MGYEYVARQKPTSLQDRFLLVRLILEIILIVVYK